MSRTARTTGALAALALLAGCAAGAEPAPQEPGSAAPAPSGSGASTIPGVQPVGDVSEVAAGFTTPWGVAVLPDGTELVSERDTALVKHVAADGSVTEAGRIPGVVADREGGLLGIALLEGSGEGSDGGADENADDRDWLYAYLTAADDNRIVRLPLEDGAGGTPALGEPELVLGGIAKADIHNGGRIAFGPDGMLYATTGDARLTEAPQHPAALNGKILRLTPEGGVPEDNPNAGSPVYSMGHRNPQGLAWDDEGQLWAAEFGQDTWDEVNRIEPGANYGWPVVEGQAGDERFVDPAVQWPTSEASPSGLAFIDGTFFLAALRCERVWALYPIQDEDGREVLDAVPYWAGEYGRIRHVYEGPGGTLRFLTSESDGGGGQPDGVDRLLESRLGPLVEG